MAKVIQGAHSLHSSTQQPISESAEGTGLGSRSLDDFQTIYREHYPAIWRFCSTLESGKATWPT
jgi:hypothetical protein